MRNEIILFVSHPCTKACVAKWESGFDSIRYINPLLMPALNGWQREICNQSKNSSSGTKKWINYIAPCGRMLRSTGEVDKYLSQTDSRLTIDMFSFDYYILINREYEANARFLKKEDITEGKENVHISCVNCVDNVEPPKFKYSAVRIAGKGVPLDIDPTKMDGCDCVDNCRDRLKCACWRKTFEATQFGGQELQANTNVGYRFRSLLNTPN
jgi:histone-lysine N-methyltransferase SETDB1